MSCPAPGDEQALLDVGARLVADRLPRSRPLWSAAFVTGPAGGKVALVLVLHHGIADGIGGLAVLDVLVDNVLLDRPTGLPVVTARHPFAPTGGHRRHAVLDAMLLDVLATEPDRLQRAFVQMFARNPGDGLLRFLDEDTSIFQEAVLVTTLPPRPFLRAMVRMLRSAARRRRGDSG